jgi:ubiquinone/menaquinone biosynthesis C-methylase UbiE
MLSRWLRPAWTSQSELMDEPDADLVTLSGNLRDLTRVNRWLGGTRLTLGAVQRLFPHLQAGDSISVLDVATGAADIPRAVHRWAEQRGLRPHIVATDLNASILRIARSLGEPSGERPGAGPLSLAVADGRRLPFGDRSFDVVHCSLSLHHLPPQEAETMLREMGRVARRGVVVNDLVRSWSGWLGAELYGRLCTRNQFTRHDGPLSVRRAYTVTELRALAVRAGLRPIAIDRFLGYRVALSTVATPDESDRS